MKIEILEGLIGLQSNNDNSSLDPDRKPRHIILLQTAKVIN